MHGASSCRRLCEPHWRHTARRRPRVTGRRVCLPITPLVLAGGPAAGSRVLCVRWAADVNQTLAVRYRRAVRRSVRRAVRALSGGATAGRPRSHVVYELAVGFTGDGAGRGAAGRSGDTGPQRCR